MIKWLIITVAAIVVAAASAAGPPVHALSARTAHVSADHAGAHIRIKLHSFPYLGFRLCGTTSYQRPDRYTVYFNPEPALARGCEKVSGDIGDRGGIDHALAYVDMATMTIRRMELFYYHGGHIPLDRHFAPVEGLLLVNRQDADIAMPSIKAASHAELAGYSIPTGVAQSE